MFKNVLFLFSIISLNLNLIQAGSNYECEFILEYREFCYVYDFQSNECGPYYLTCPIIDVLIEGHCYKAVCSVRILFL